MPLRSVKMNRFIFGFQRRVWCPKWTPLSRSWRMVTTAMTGPFAARSGILPVPRASGDRRAGRAVAVLRLSVPGIGPVTPGVIRAGTARRGARTAASTGAARRAGPAERRT
ncbi:hypothetical protein GCM10023216_27380 [Isoptericola chiayiensis]|uniref:Uncharacterized protein n=1 Tax=Isoptericola chiayiensis TaxID=579446 RepID=A0ABP8YP79_9MICO